ncbi:AAA family ATPase [Planosporangium thailandense]|uniref:AAA family ATPase n=1 Tax=Planosporangium thailandense TaxID=765197 RepID=A0ABX0Y812_9ACTN|nr:AAA family ATPase [Planosporangium thailandense]
MRSRPVADLVGRTAELEQIDSLLAGHRPIGPGLLLRGDPGVGKTALLDAAAARAQAAEMRVLRASGAEFEADIGFSALHQLLYPLRERADRLASRHRDVLHQVFGLAPGPAPDPLVVSTAVLALLGQVAAERPLLVLVDDVPWIDHASATVLGFVTRRIGNDPIAFLAAARTGVDSFFDQVRLPEREISPLGEQPAATLLDILHPNLPPPVRRRLLDEAAGNPLALRELPALLTERQRSGQDTLPAFLPLNGRLEAIFAAGVRALPAPTQQALLLAALEPDASLATIRSAAHGRADVDDLAPAQQADLVRIDAVTGPMVFRHPLIRSAIVQTSSPAERRAAHQALAAALAGDPERRAWHLAEAATGPDETVARALDEAALAAWRRGDPPGAAAPAADEATISDRRRGGASAAVAALVRAGELSPHPADRSRRLVEAAYLANLTGQLDQVPRLLADAGHGPDTPTGLVFAATAYLLTHAEGEIDAAQRLLARALDDIADTAKTTNNWDSYGILYALLVVSIFAARPEPWQLLNTALGRFDPEAVTPFRLCYDAYVDPVRTADTVREGIAHAFAALPADAAPWQVIPLAWAAVGVDALSDYRYLVRRVIDRQRDGGAITMVIAGLRMLCIDSYSHGQWDEAETMAREGLDLTAVCGYQLLEGQLRSHLACIAAARGNVDRARALTDEITTWAASHGIGVTQAYALRARTLAALGQGDYEEAYVQAARATPPGAPSSGFPDRWMILDLVAAAVHTGRRQEARAHVAAVQQAGIARISPRTALLIAGAAALAADDDQAGPLFETALSLPETDRWPFEQARIHLYYGQWLRRTHDTTRARLHLRAAIETFDRLGARPWAERAGNELRATGIPTTARPDTRSATLTAQERQIAALAATGLTNKQIGQQLFLSHRTVGAHLHRIFPKLGITSRAALRDALETITPDENDQAPQSASPNENQDGQRSRFAMHRRNSAESHNAVLNALNIRTNLAPLYVKR